MTCMKVTTTTKGNLSATVSFLEKCSKSEGMEKMDKVGEVVTDALAKASPVKTGEFAAGWKYECVKENGVPTVNIYNDSHDEVSNLAKMLEYGYATKNSYIQGRHFIERTMRDMERKIIEEMGGVITDVEQTY